MNPKAVCAAFLLALASYLPAAYAVCIDPATGRSGYQVPLEAGVRTAEAIVIGHVLSEARLLEDPTDPDGCTASSITINVLARLKGKPPSVIVIRNENTSSRYLMSAGEKHILFVFGTNDETWVNRCGNSAVMPGGGSKSSSKFCGSYRRRSKYASAVKFEHALSLQGFLVRQHGMPYRRRPA
ncbi:hypothetical protein [Massilia niastensis]|uniref:hypothetical protein n=1 Tax=Massilia niastensis TaxID=544911 RepID=UPI0012EC301E|nr:hypothetical protein [Massilia niastensis]